MDGTADGNEPERPAYPEVAISPGQFKLACVLEAMGELKQAAAPDSAAARWWEDAESMYTGPATEARAGLALTQGAE